MFFFTPRVNEEFINKGDNEQVQILFENSYHQIHEAAGALISPNDVTTNS